MEIIDNIHSLLGDDLKKTIKKGDKLSIVASCFSIYAYESLKKELESIDELRFIFNSPTFIKDKIDKEKREFYIPKLNRERSLYGTEFEIKLKNELTQKAIAKECSDWIKRKVTFKSNKTNAGLQGFVNIEQDVPKNTYTQTNGFTTVDLGYEKGNNLSNIVIKLADYSHTKTYFTLFDQIWNDSEKLEDITNEVVEYISTVYNENSPEFIYFVILYNIFNEFLEDITENILPNEATGFKETEIWKRLYNFQKDAVIGIINKLEKYNGCILADSVGLGKTFTALGVIKYYELRNKSVLVLCPKKLSENWNTYRENYTNNILAKDRFNYDVLYHTDLSRDGGYSNGINLGRLNWSNYDLLIIDESHNFRNNDPYKNKQTRYQRLMNDVIKKGVKTSVLMLSATPVNNKFTDLRNQLALAYEGNPSSINAKLNTERGIEDIFRRTQLNFNKWSRLPNHERTTEALLQMLDFDFFELLDSLTIARSRKHIQRYYNVEEIGKFPSRLKPISHFCELTDREDVINYNEIFNELTKLNLSLYAPFNYILPSRLNFYSNIYDTVVKGGLSSLRQADRERSLQTLMRINLLKRLESSVDAFRLTLSKLLTNIENILEDIDNFDRLVSNVFVNQNEINSINLDEDDWLDEDYSIGSTVKINLADIDRISWKEDLANDRDVIVSLLEEMAKITPEHDTKLRILEKIISEKIYRQMNPGNKKVIIFTAFADTADYLYEHISKYVKENYNLDTAKVVGSDANKTTLKIKNDLHTILTCFSPISKEKHLTMPHIQGEIDILIATDCISEGQNLQDCDYLINYDIHWNPVRITQRFGRIDRIGSKNDTIQLVNFWPDMTLDEYIKLKERVENRMIISDVTATGDDNYLTNKSTDLEYRKEQLKKLQEEVLDLEDINTGVSITDLGLNDFRMDLVSYEKDNGELDKVPNGLHTVIMADKEKGIVPGVIFVLKNINDEIDKNKQNMIYPFYLVYMKYDGEVYLDHLKVKKILDVLRTGCKGKDEPIKEEYLEFNKETKDGKKMDKYSTLLEETIKTIVDVNEDSDIDSLFSAGGTTALLENINGLDDFELIAFVVIR
ncbi:helicase-related protein [Proteiniborus sp.]|uniref:helicase-related protein n=1 Tax=Proteiniborus sp. TaxID=2079015 RepID=UPI0033170B9F